MERSSVNLPAWISLFVRANHRCCFIEYAVDELMAVFCAERFRQFDRFVNGHFVWHIATFRQFVQRNAQYCFSTCPSSSSRRDRYGFISPSRYAVLVATPASSSRKYRTSTSLHPVQPGTGIQHQRCRSGTTARSRAPGRHTHERGDEQQVSRISLTNFRP